MQSMPSAEIGVGVQRDPPDVSGKEGVHQEAPLHGRQLAGIEEIRSSSLNAPRVSHY